MNFIVENYLWIIIAIVVILMAVVGYIAEKTEFIKKTEKPAKQPKEKKKKVEEPIVIEDKGIDELLQKATKKSKNKTANIIESDSASDLMTPLVSDTTDNAAQVSEDLMAPLVSEPVADNITEPVSDDLMAPLTNDSVVENTDTVDQSLFAPLDSTAETTNEVVEGPVEPIQEVDGSSNIVDDEDIWKF